MKTFKEFQKESYSRVDEGLSSLATGAASLASRGFGGIWGGSTARSSYDSHNKRGGFKGGTPHKGKSSVKNALTVGGGVAGAFPVKTLKTAAKVGKFLAWDVPKAVLGTAAAMSKMR